MSRKTRIALLIIILTIGLFMLAFLIRDGHFEGNTFMVRIINF